MASPDLQHRLQFGDPRYWISVRSRRLARRAPTEMRANRRDSGEDSLDHMVPGCCHKNRHPPAATADSSKWPPMQLPSSTPSGALRSPRRMVVIGIPEESRSDALWRFEALPSPLPPRLIRKWRCPARCPARCRANVGSGDGRYHRPPRDSQSGKQMTP
jgi:hypothetical protein